MANTVDAGRVMLILKESKDDITKINQGRIFGKRFETQAGMYSTGGSNGGIGGRLGLNSMGMGMKSLRNTIKS